MSARQPVTIGELDSGDPATRQEWDAFVEAHPEGTFFHRAGWKTVMERSFGHPGRFLVARQGGLLVGLCPLVHLRSRLFGNTLVSNAFCVYGGPLVKSDAALTALDEAALKLARDLQVDHVEYRLRRPLHESWEVKDDLYATFRKTIDPDVDANLKAIPRKQRAMIRKGIKFGLDSQVENDLDLFYRLFAESVRNLGTPVFAKTYMRSLCEVFAEDHDIIVIRHEGEPVTAVLSFYFRDEVLPYYAGSAPKARDLAANDFMYWEVMRRACERNYRLFDFGRSKTGTGSHAFKKNWGFTPEQLSYEYRPVNAKHIAEINPLNPKYRLAISAWQRLPLWMANTLGPLISRGLG